MYKNYNKIVRIDTIEKIDLDTVTLPDICWEYGTGVAISTGDKRVGTYKSNYRCGVMTDMGDIQRDIWRQVAEHIARRDGQEWLVKALVEWEDARNYCNQSKEEVYFSALFLYSHEAFDDPQWYGFIPFNRKYRADALKLAHIVPVVTACCKKPCDITQEQIDHAYRKQIVCPHCGCTSAFFIVGNTDDLPWIES